MYIIIWHLKYLNLKTILRPSIVGGMPLKRTHMVPSLNIECTPREFDIIVIFIPKWLRSPVRACPCTKTRFELHICIFSKLCQNCTYIKSTYSLSVLSNSVEFLTIIQYLGSRFKYIAWTPLEEYTNLILWSSRSHMIWHSIYLWHKILY